MNEADLVRHLSAQTAQAIVRFELPHLSADRAAMDHELDRLVAQAPGAVLFDSATPAHLTEVGRLLDGLSGGRDRPRLCVGSSGLEYAMTQWWRESAAKSGDGISLGGFEQFDAVSQVLAVSGSASPLSALQIDAAVAAGFADVPVDARALVAAADWQGSLDQLATRTIEALRQGRSVILHTARGAQDQRIEALIDALMAAGQTRDEARHEGGRVLGQRLGQLVDHVLRAVPLRRLLLSGGDTSSQITQRLAPDALRIEARLAPGAPLCRVVSREPHLKSLQLALKGGQMGQADYFVKALHGTARNRAQAS